MQLLPGDTLGRGTDDGDVREAGQRQPYRQPTVVGGLRFHVDGDPARSMVLGCASDTSAKASTIARTASVRHCSRVVPQACRRVSAVCGIER